jgi:glycyl-tRNA synthetase alpha chain
MNIQNIIKIFIDYWTAKGCLLLPPSGMIMGAATFHPQLFFGLKKNITNNYVYIQPCIRRCDGVYGQSTNRVTVHHQLQVIMQPVPSEFHNWMYECLQLIGIHSSTHLLQELDSEWKSESLGAFGTGWEVRVNTLEILQYTYFDTFAYKKIEKTGELAFGLERLATVTQGLPIMECKWNDAATYGDLFFTQEKEMSEYYLNSNVIKQSDFWDCLNLCNQCAQNTVKYEYFVRMNDIYNCLDALSLLDYKTKKTMIKAMAEVVKNI